MQQETNPLGELLKRYIAGDCTPEEEEIVAGWYNSLGKDRKELSLSKEDELALKHKLWQNIRTSVTGNRGKSRGIRWLIYLPGAAAVLLLVFIFFLKREGPGNNKKETGLEREILVHQKINNTGKTFLVVLQDESMVWLKPGGSIRYADFSKSSRREITLSGEAYFEVAKNREKPFFVYSGNVVTRVTGTKFNVKAYETGNTVEVEVTEGSVEVTGGTGEDTETRAADLKLTAMQKAVYHTGSQKMEKLTGIVSQLKKIETISEEISFEFSDAPLRKVIDLLEEAYHVSIELENTGLESCPLTASLNNETLDIKLELICRSIGATFSKSPGKILISGEGCTL